VVDGDCNAVRAHMNESWETVSARAQLQDSIKGPKVGLYRGMISFLMHDREWPSDVSKSQRKKRCGELAKRMMLRNIGFSALLADACT
jgi:pyoverdine/dityrosine biosynthesis protein Dit1